MNHLPFSLIEKLLIKLIITILDDPDDSHQVQAQIEEANRRLAGLVQPAQSPSSWQNLRPAQHGAGCASSHHRIHTRLTVHSPQHSVTDLIGRGRECQIHVGEVSLVSRGDARNV